MKSKFIVLLSNTFRMYSFHGGLKLDWTITVFTQLRFCQCVSAQIICYKLLHLQTKYLSVRNDELYSLWSYTGIIPVTPCSISLISTSASERKVKPSVSHQSFNKISYHCLKSLSILMISLHFLQECWNNADVLNWF